MPIDPRIVLGMQQFQMPNPLQIQGQAEELRASRQRNKLADLAFAEKDRAAQEANAISGLYRDATNPDGTMNREKFLSGAAQKGLGARIPEWQKGFAEQDEAQHKAAREQFGFERDKMALIGQVAGTAKDQASYERAVRFLQSKNIDVSQFPPTYDPAFVEQGRMQALTLVQQMDQQWRQHEAEREERRLKEEKRHHIAMESKTEKSAQAKPPAGYRLTADGSGLEAIPGGPADKATTVSEGERNAAGFAERMAEAEKIIEGVSAEAPSAQKPGLIEHYAGNGVIANASRSEPRQKYRQAQEDWVRSKLRKESGAAIGADEMEREISMYFPQIGDKPEVIKQKAKARSTAIEAMRKSSGRAATSEPKAAPKDAPADDIADLLKKYGS